MGKKGKKTQQGQKPQTGGDQAQGQPQPGPSQPAAGQSSQKQQDEPQQQSKKKQKKQYQQQQPPSEQQQPPPAQQQQQPQSPQQQQIGQSQELPASPEDSSAFPKLGAPATASSRGRGRGRGKSAFSPGTGFEGLQDLAKSLPSEGVPGAGAPSRGRGPRQQQQPSSYQQQKPSSYQQQRPSSSQQQQPSPYQQQRPSSYQQQQPSSSQQQQPSSYQQQQPSPYQQQQPSSYQQQRPSPYQQQQPSSSQQQQPSSYQQQQPSSSQQQQPYQKQEQRPPQPQQIPQQPLPKEQQQQLPQLPPQQRPQQQRTLPGGDARGAGASSVVPFRAGLQIPTRASITVAGTKGRHTQVRTNHLALNLQKLTTKTALHYDVAIDPDKPKKLLRRVVEEFRHKHFPNRYPAFDGRKNLYSASDLPFDHKREFRDTITIVDPERQKQKEFKVTLKFATRVDLTSLNTYMRSGTTLDAPQQAIQVLDVVLRCAPALWFVPVGRSYFTPPTGSVESLGDGYEIWYGLFQSVNLGWQPFVNVDVVHKGFPSSQPVIDLIREICSSNRGEANLQRGLDEYQQSDLRKFLAGLKVDYMLPNNPSSKRTYKVNNLAEPASTLSFVLDNGRRVTVQQYFEQEKRIPLKYRNLPCLHVGSLRRENPIYVPIEFCTITAGQVTQKKLNERQTSNMIRKAATSTQDRERKIREALEKASFNSSPQVREFGLQVNEKFQEIKARVLEPPQLEYKDRTSLTPRKGVWQAQQFRDGKNLSKWIILVLAFRVSDEDIGKFVYQFTQQGRNLGMVINDPLPTRKMDSRRIRSDLEPFLRDRAREGCELVVVVVPEKGNEYAIVKQTAELVCGVLTQCVKNSTISRKMSYATAQNILLKVNSKLNGVNHIMHGVSRPKIFSVPIMIVGADVTHPSPDETKIPSVAAVCASHDPNAFQYNTQFRLQPPRMEIIQDLQEIMKQHLIFFYRKTNAKKPQRILFYRDGVSEGQFQQVLDSELTAIRSACSSLETGYKPAITFLVVQKRHHTRFFPIDKRDSDGRNCNVLPGTIVDTTITHPTERDFYLVSHASIQGVSRPTKYHCLWDDNQMTEDELEELTYFLCHMFSRCTRSVSYPAPTYYAHLAAYRARVYLQGQNLEGLSDERLRTELLAQLQKQSPMYFV